MKYRKKLIETLADAWREAETHYLETGDGRWKVLLKRIQDRLNLNDFEKLLLNEVCEQRAV